MNEFVWHYELLFVVACSFFFLRIRPPPGSTLFPYTTLFRSVSVVLVLRWPGAWAFPFLTKVTPGIGLRSEEHTSELQSRQYLVCRLLLEKKKNSMYDQQRQLDERRMADVLTARESADSVYCA